MYMLYMFGTTQKSLHRLQFLLIKIYENAVRLRKLEMLRLTVLDLVFITDELTLTLMILLLKLFSTTIMSSESAGESVPSWLRRKKERMRERLKHEVYSQFVNPRVRAQHN